MKKNQSDNSQSDNEGSIDGHDPSSNDRDKHKRRSKTDNHGRDFVCGCGKRYLSYPALYTHIKTKHSGATPSGTKVPSCEKNRLRKVGYNLTF